MIKSLKRKLGDIKVHLKDIPSRYLASYAKSLTGEAGLRLAIKSKCRECCGFENVTNRVRGCECYSCPLWAYRDIKDESKE